ncbi:UNVERIFIED_CONTAM: hypothetical protein FKN15_072934 [Acipenser sinensis]
MDDTHLICSLEVDEEIQKMEQQIAQLTGRMQNIQRRSKTRTSENPRRRTLAAAERSWQPKQTLLSPRSARRPAPGTGGALPPRHSRVVRRLVDRVGAFRLRLTPSPLHLLSGAASVSIDHPWDSLILWDIKCWADGTFGPKMGAV